MRCPARYCSANALCAALLTIAVETWFVDVVTNPNYPNDRIDKAEQMRTYRSLLAQLQETEAKLKNPCFNENAGDAHNDCVDKSEYTQTVKEFESDLMKLAAKRNDLEQKLAAYGTFPFVDGKRPPEYQEVSRVNEDIDTNLHFLDAYLKSKIPVDSQVVLPAPGELVNNAMDIMSKIRKLEIELIGSGMIQSGVDMRDRVAV